MKNDKMMFMSGTIAAALLALAATGCSGAPGPSTGPDGKENVGSSAQALSPSDPVAEVAVAFYTGGDDKRGNSVVTWQLTVGGITSTHQTDGSGNDWGNDTWTGFFYANLPQNTTNGQITNLGVNLAEHSSFVQTADNWNCNEISVWTENPNGSWTNIATPGGNPLFRLTGSQGQWWWGTWPQ
jgi:hypothetical protein